MRVVIDADVLVYSCGFATEGQPLNYTLHAVNTGIQKILTACGTEDYTVYIGGKGNFRDEIAISAGYKATRPKRKPTAYDDIRDYLVREHDAIMVDGMEADDAVSIELYADFKENPSQETAKVVLSSLDKDLNNTPGLHYHPKKGTFSWITQRQADRHFLFQLLTGDRVDNIQGLPNLPVSYLIAKGAGSRTLKGIGEATAKKLLRGTATAYEARDVVLDCYFEWGASEGLNFRQVMSYLEEQAILLWMVREVDELGRPIIFNFSEEFNERAEYLYNKRSTSESGGTGFPESTGGKGSGESGSDGGGSHQARGEDSSMHNRESSDGASDLSPRGGTEDSEQLSSILYSLDVSDGDSGDTREYDEAHETN